MEQIHIWLGKSWVGSYTPLDSSAMTREHCRNWAPGKRTLYTVHTAFVCPAALDHKYMNQNTLEWQFILYTTKVTIFFFIHLKEQNRTRRIHRNQSGRRALLWDHCTSMYPNSVLLTRTLAPTAPERAWIMASADRNLERLLWVPLSHFFVTGEKFLFLTYRNSGEKNGCKGRGWQMDFSYGKS